MRLLDQNPRLAEQQALEILKVYPGTETAIRIQAAACRRQGNPARSLALLKPLADWNNDSPSFLYEYGQTLGAMGHGADAVTALRKAVRLDPSHSSAWRALGDQLAVASATNCCRRASGSSVPHGLENVGTQ